MSLIDKVELDSLMLLHGKPILIPTTQIRISPIYLREITGIGVDIFFQYLNTLTCDMVELLDNKAEIFGEFSELTHEEKNYLVFLSMCGNFDDFREDVVDALSFFIKKEVFYSKEFSIINFVLKDKNKENVYVPITSEIFECLRYILKRQNYLLGQEEEKYNPSDEKATQIIDKIKKGRAKLEKHNGSPRPSFTTLVSSLAAKGNGINFFNIWNMNYYAFNDQLLRLKMIEDYDLGINSILAGADSKKVKLKYWIQDIQTK